MYDIEMYKLGATRTGIRELFEYGIRQAAIVGKENVYDYSIGNPSVPAPEAVKEAVMELLEGDPVALHGYTPAAGDAWARNVIAEDLSKRFGDDIKGENVYFTCGAAPAVVGTIRALRKDADTEILLLAPFFPEYTMYMQACDVKGVVVPPDTENFQVDLKAVEERISPNTQAMIVNSPNNPSGVVLSRKTLEELGALLERKSAEYGHPIYIIADEPYRELVYDGAEVPYIPAIYPNTVICYSWSKSLSLPGERIGYYCVPPRAADSADLFKAIQGAMRTLGHVCAPSMMQKVAAMCVAKGIKPDMRVYEQNRKTLYEALTSYGYRCIKPQGAFYMLIQAPNGDDNEFSELAKAKNLLIVPGTGFGCPGFLRLSTCVDPAMVERSLPAFKALME